MRPGIPDAGGVLPLSLYPKPEMSALSSAVAELSVYVHRAHAEQRLIDPRNYDRPTTSFDLEHFDSLTDAESAAAWRFCARVWDSVKGSACFCVQLRRESS